MSWSGTGTIKKGSSTQEMVAVIDSITIFGQDDLAEERGAAVDFCKDVVQDALRSGTLGKLEEHTWKVDISGHATSGNQGGGDGKGSDCLTISITQAPWLEEKPAASE